jgi:hypothetical protein
MVAKLSLQLFTPGGLSDADCETIRRSYSSYHGTGDLSHVRHVEFWLDHNSEAFKGYRRWVDTAIASSELPPALATLIFLHWYAVAGWESGVLIEVVAARQNGATKAQVLEMLAYAYIHAGPMGMSRVAEQSSAYLKNWTETTAENVQWPPGWGADPAAFKSGLDFSQADFTADETDRLLDWFRRHHGEVPSYVRFLAKWNPRGLKSFRNRYESAVKTLPKQIAPLATFLSAGILGESEAMRRAAFQARFYGVTRAQMLPVIQSTMIHNGDLSMSKVADVMDKMLDDWP